MTDSYVIPIDGLKVGRNTISRHVGKDFFESYDNSEIHGADLDVHVVLDKDSALHCEVRINGTLTVQCDRCLEDVDLPVKVEERIRIERGTDGADEIDGEEVVYVTYGSEGLDFGQIIYDYSILALPIKRVHDDGRCNPKMIGYISDGDFPEEGDDNSGEVYSPFAGLKGMLDK